MANPFTTPGASEESFALRAISLVVLARNTLLILGRSDPGDGVTDAAMAAWLGVLRESHV